MATDKELKEMPRSVTVGPYRYAVEVDGEAAYDYDYLGCTLNRSRRLVLDPRQSRTELPQTFMHEVLHAIGSAYEIDMVAKHTLDATTHRPTDKIDLLASALVQFIRQNPKALEFILVTAPTGE